MHDHTAQSETVRHDYPEEIYALTGIRTIRCLRCNGYFPSEGKDNRICPKCKSKKPGRRLTADERELRRRWRPCIVCHDIFEFNTNYEAACPKCKKKRKQQMDRELQKKNISVSTLHKLQTVFREIPCMKCERPFLSEGKHNRMCPYCRRWFKDGDAMEEEEI